jgi:Zn-dependent membrane protease YugP
MFFDPLYLLLVLLPGMAISGIASWMVRSAFDRYSRVPARSGMTGAQAAQHLLDRAGIHDVEIVPAHGYLSDHYNPMTKQLALSQPVFSQRSIAAIGVATHEAGHAIQHAKGYVPLGLRSAIVPMAQIGSSLGYIVMAIGLALIGSSPLLGKWVVAAGAILFSMILLFQIVTLPVEFNASARAKRLVVEAGIIAADERTGIDRVLNAAALTYVAAAISTLLTLLYYLYRSGLLGGRRDG